MASTHDEEECQAWLDKVKSVQEVIHNLNTNSPDSLAAADQLIDKFRREKEDAAEQEEKAKQKAAESVL